MGSSSREGELSDIVRKVEERLVSLKQAVESEVKPELAKVASLTAKEEAEMQNMRQQNSALKLLVDQLLAAQSTGGPRGSLVGMTKCLFCSDTGDPFRGNSMMGSDGRMYKTASARPQSQPDLLHLSRGSGHGRTRAKEH